MAEIKGIELLVVDQKETTEKYEGYKLRVVQWVIDGVSKSVKLERRKFFMKDGEVKMGKADGLTMKDLDLLKPHWPKIVDLLRNPPPLPTPKEERPAESDEAGW